MRISEGYRSIIDSGGVINAEIAYGPGVAAAFEWETRILGVDPRTDLNFVNEEVQHVLFHRAADLDVKLSDVFTREEELEAVVAVPWSVRSVYNPNLR